MDPNKLILNVIRKDKYIIATMKKNNERRPLLLQILKIL